MEGGVIEIQSRFVSDSTPSNNDFKNEIGFLDLVCLYFLVWTTLKSKVNGRCSFGLDLISNMDLSIIGHKFLCNSR